jgi:hypothetical protein
MISDGNPLLNTCDLIAGRARVSIVHCCGSDQSQLVDTDLVNTALALKFEYAAYLTLIVFIC